MALKQYCLKNKQGMLRLRGPSGRTYIFSKGLPLSCGNRPDQKVLEKHDDVKVYTPPKKAPAKKSAAKKSAAKPDDGK